ncbi:MAG: EAL domain-containing protein, partial [Burkholderiaceae bacterium]|nr:EAL domain-containing protein [Burkholderiaceae bacterium]
KIPLRDAEGRIYGLCGISTDLTENKQIQDEMHALAYYDALTPLPNRRLLMDRVAQSLAVYGRNHRNGALIVADVDGFSLVNNTLGHEAGDLILQQIAQRLLGAVRSEDTIARSSSDEFVILLHDLSVHREEAAQQAQVVIRKIRAVLNDSYQIDAHRQAITACLGVAFFSDSGKDADDILRLADMALHQAKVEGPGSLRFFNHAMQISAQTRASLESDLRVALVKNQFYLDYQPQVASHGPVVGVEALLRWRHPDKGVVPPAQFIGVAESSALILPLGHWILEQACQQITAWENDPVLSAWTIAVNVSARQLQQDNFVEEVAALLHATGANPHRLELELTESILVSDVNLVESKMNQLAQMGVQFALDDFGTGYSSLSYLKRLPLNKLKIDKSFIDELNTDAHSDAIVRTIVSLARNLGMRVIAEGVETLAQVQALKAMGGIDCQGYFFARPLHAEDLVDWHRRYQASATLSPP